MATALHKYTHTQNALKLITTPINSYFWRHYLIDRKLVNIITILYIRPFTEPLCERGGGGGGGGGERVWWHGHTKLVLEECRSDYGDTIAAPSSLKNC